MITEEKIKEVKKLLRGGVPAGEVKENLIREGYSEEDIAKVFTPHQYDMRTWYLSFAIILLLVAIYLFLQNESFLVFIFSFLLFVQYYRETRRVKRNNTRL